jgi:hypothetical protein
MSLSVDFNEIIKKRAMCDNVLNMSVGLKKCLDPVRISCWFDTTINIIIEELQVQVPIILDDHVVENHSCHDVVEGFLVP